MMNQDRAVVTGASGFLGSAVARKLAARGLQVRAVVRPTSSRSNLAGLDCEIVEADMRDAASLGPAMRDARYLFHLAADYRLWTREPKQLLHNNCEGTRNIMRAAARAGVERIVYTSSVATLGPRRDGLEADERDQADLGRAVGAYKKSKIASERLVQEMICDGLPAVIVNPSAPVGPRDIRPTPTGRILIEAAMGRVPAYVDTGLNLVHADDVAEGHLLALERGRIGERYILGGQNVSLREILAEIARLSGRRAPFVRLPRALIYPIALAAEGIAHLADREPFITRAALAMSKQCMFFSSRKAEHELGYSARPYRAALHDAIRWFQEYGYIRGVGPLAWETLHQTPGLAAGSPAPSREVS